MKKIILLLLIMLLGVGSNYLSAQESKYKALYLVNFTKYMDWSGEDITIGVIGNSQVLLELESLIKQNSRIRILKIAGSESVSECNMIFLPEAQSRNFDLIQDRIGSAQTVLVTEDESLISEGAEMAFYTENNKLRFIINKSELDKSGVKVSAQLLGQGKIVN